LRESRRTAFFTAGDTAYGSLAFAGTTTSRNCATNISAQTRRPYCPGNFPTLTSIAAKYAARSSMSLSDRDGATTLIASFFRSPDLYACNCVTR
jgi:hypothetical protein